MGGPLSVGCAGAKQIVSSITARTSRSERDSDLERSTHNMNGKIVNLDPGQMSVDEVLDCPACPEPLECLLCGGSLEPEDWGAPCPMCGYEN